MTGDRHFVEGAADGALPRTGAEELAAGSGPSAGKRGNAMIDLVRSEEAMTTPGAMVERGGEGGALALGEGGQRSALGQVLAEQAIGVFVGAALPRVMGSSEVEGGVELALQGLVHMELGAVVGGDGADGMRFVAQEGDGALQSFVGTDASDFADANQAAFAFDDRDGGGLTATMHGVDLPITEPGALVDDGRALRDHALTGETTSAIVARVAFALEFAGAAQMEPEGSPACFVGPDMQVDCLVAHDAHPFNAQAADDLLGTEVLAQHLLDRGEVRGPIAAIAARARTATAGLLRRPTGAIRSVIARAVPLHFPPDGAAVSAQLLRDLRDAGAAHSQCTNLVSFFRA